MEPSSRGPDSKILPHSSGRFQISLSLTDNHSSSVLFERSELPNAFRAKGRPSHLLTIAFPILSRCTYSSLLLAPNACRSNRSQESSSDNLPIW
uniref:Uncharacterized protein n=1 Tax=Salix viminalis TaxID=40686 RepID=A0A6N2K908_SALVM